MSQIHWCGLHQGPFELREGDAVRSIRARFHEGYTTVCPDCYQDQLTRGLYDEHGEWRRRAAETKATWEVSPFKTLHDAVAMARHIMKADAVALDEPGIEAYLVGEWLIAQRPGEPIKQLHIGPETNRIFSKPRPPSTRLAQLCTLPYRDLSHVREVVGQLKPVIEGTFMCIVDPKGGERSWYFEIELEYGNKVFAVLESQLTLKENKNNV